MTVDAPYYPIGYILWERYDIFNIYVEYVFNHLSLLITFTWFTIFGIRIFLLYYDHQYNKALSTSKWKILLDPNFENTDWFLQNRHLKYGKEKWLLKWIAIPIIGVYYAIYSCVYWLLPWEMESIINFSFLLFALVLLAIHAGIFSRKYPKFQDVFMVKSEFKANLYTGITLIISWIITMTTMMLIYGHLMFYAAIQGMIALCATLALMIVYPQIKIQKEAINIRSRLSQVVQNQSDNHLIYWSQVIQSKNGYESFANFLASEFSVENILWISEYVQFKQKMMKCHVLKEKFIKLELKFDIKLPDGVPQSKIAEQFDENRMEESVYECAYKLYCKYIDSSQAMMEVNISYQLRGQMMNVFRSNINKKSDTIDMILRLMENAAMEISQLMNDSYSRFKRNKIFVDLKQTNTLKNLF